MIGLGQIRHCLEGAIPTQIATAAADGTPNVAYLSQVFYVDDAHLALSFQFFNKTRRNVLETRTAVLLVADPETGAFFRIRIEYLRTETAGALFESMRANLEGIASHTGMSAVFKLRGSDIYRVLAVERVPGDPLPAADFPPDHSAALRRISERLAECPDTESLLDGLLAALDEYLGMGHSMVLLLDRLSGRLYNVASHGYSRSGIGWEIPLGEGVIGVAAQVGAAIRIVHSTQAYSYVSTIRDSLVSTNQGTQVSTEIPFPGLPDWQSLVAMPIRAAGQMQGVLFVESRQERAFSYRDEDALAVVAAQFGALLPLLQSVGDTALDAEVGEPEQPPPAGEAVELHYYPPNHSMFAGNEYLIKGVAGAILLKLVRGYLETGRTCHSNRELRLDPSLGLPDVGDNLEARLVLLQRRLAEHNVGLTIERTGRGRFSLRVSRPVMLVSH